MYTSTAFAAFRDICLSIYSVEVIVCVLCKEKLTPAGCVLLSFLLFKVCRLLPCR